MWCKVSGISSFYSKSLRLTFKIPYWLKCNVTHVCVKSCMCLCVCVCILPLWKCHIRSWVRRQKCHWGASNENNATYDCPTCLSLFHLRLDLLVHVLSTHILKKSPVSTHLNGYKSILINLLVQPWKPNVFFSVSAFVYYYFSSLISLVLYLNLKSYKHQS